MNNWTWWKQSKAGRWLVQLWMYLRMNPMCARNFDCDQVILTGHIAGFTKEALNQIAMTNANQIIEHFKK